MIPVRIAVKNFLTYATAEGAKPIVFDFDGAALWSVAGDNGAGKSALFDAITWTLFDQHRGGGQKDERLVRHGAPGCYASFEFRIDERIYKVERSLTVRAARPKTWQASVFVPEVNDFQPIPDTSNKAGFERFIQEKLGLKHGTFIASTLLLQGQSDRLILAKPKERFDILAGLLDLGRYQDLADRAHEHASSASGEVKGLDARLAGIPVVEEAALAAARENVRLTTDAFAAAQKRAESAAVLIVQAKAHADLVRDLSDTRTKLSRATKAIANAEQIRAEHDEGTLLTAVIPEVRAAIGHLSAADAEDAKARASETALGAIDIAALQESATGALDAECAADDEVTKAQAALTECDQTRVESEREISELDTCERLEKDSTREQDAIAKLTTALEGRTELEARVTVLELRRDAQPLFEQLATSQKEFGSREKTVVKLGTLASWNKTLATCQAELKAAAKAKTEAEDERTAAQDELAQVKADERVARDTLTERRAARGEAICSHCGQKVTAAHMAIEIEKAESALRKASGLVEAATARVTSVATKVTKATKGVAEATAKRDDARDKRVHAKTAEVELTTARAAVTTAERAIAKAAPALRAAVRELSELSLAARNTSLRELAELPALRATLTELHKKAALLDDASGRLAKIEDELAPLQKALPAVERTKRRARQRELKKERERLQGALEQVRTVYTRAKKARELADQSLTTARTKKVELAGQIEQHRTTAKAQRSLADVRLKDVPDAWRARAREQDAGLLAELDRRSKALSGSEARYQELVEAEKTHEALATQVSSIEEQIEKIPVEQRISVEAAQADQKEALALRSSRERERDAANTQAQDLAQRCKQRTELEETVAAARRRAHLYGRLEDLLGRRRLQAFLIDEALRGVEAFANETLGRVSDHQLEVHLRREQTASGEEEIVIRATDHSSADAPLDIEFISGGQKFRVAVALAAGIGHAGGMRGAPRALIVDEGFGSLDVRGRQEMIAELHSLSQYLERVIVVSHHDDFRDKLLFPSRYVISRNGDAATVERLM